MTTATHFALQKQSDTGRLFLAPALHFGAALLRASLTRWTTVLFTTLTPLFMLVLFWLIGLGAEGDAAAAGVMFPVIVGFTVMLAGQSLAMRIATWRQQGIFMRLACTPVPLGSFVIGASLAQIVLALVQATGVLLFGAVVLGLDVDPLGALLGILLLTLAATCFIGFSLATAVIGRTPEVANMLYIFLLLPMFFLGGGFPAEILPDFLQGIGAWLPTSFTNELITPLIQEGRLPQDPLLPVLGLLGYTVIFGAVAAWRFDWE